jgi:hypothetical protein
MSERACDSEERLNRYPILKKRFFSLPDIVEDKSGIYEKADEAELKFIEEVRRMSNELMRERASGKESVRAGELRRSSGSFIGHGKKTASADNFRRGSYINPEKYSGIGFHKTGVKPPACIPLP